MVGVATVALLERKPTISRDLFTRYWRDVHGVMAARIPGFESYTQYHVTPLSAKTEPFEGIAIVTYASEADRAGLISGAVVPHIHRDEQNVFRRALLYNLAEGAVIGTEADRQIQTAWFLVIAKSSSDHVAIVTKARSHSPDFLVVYDLRSGDPSGWNDTDVTDGGSGREFSTLIRGSSSVQDLAEALEPFSGDIALYEVEHAFTMVSEGRPTPLGLRGQAAVDTIREAGAINQLDLHVENAVYRLA